MAVRAGGGQAGRARGSGHRDVRDGARGRPARPAGVARAGDRPAGGDGRRRPWSRRPPPRSRPGSGRRDAWTGAAGAQGHGGSGAQGARWRAGGRVAPGRDPRHPAGDRPWSGAERPGDEPHDLPGRAGDGAAHPPSRPAARHVDGERGPGRPAAPTPRASSRSTRAWRCAAWWSSAATGVEGSLRRAIGRDVEFLLGGDSLRFVRGTVLSLDPPAFRVAGRVLYDMPGRPAFPDSLVQLAPRAEVTVEAARAGARPPRGVSRAGADAGAPATRSSRPASGAGRASMTGAATIENPGALAIAGARGAAPGGGRAAGRPGARVRHGPGVMPSPQMAMAAPAPPSRGVGRREPRLHAARHRGLRPRHLAHGGALRAGGAAGGAVVRVPRQRLRPPPAVARPGAGPPRRGHLPRAAAGGHALRRHAAPRGRGARAGPRLGGPRPAPRRGADPAHAGGARAEAGHRDGVRHHRRSAPS